MWIAFSLMIAKLGFYFQFFLLLKHQRLATVRVEDWMRCASFSSGGISSTLAHAFKVKLAR